LNKDYISNNTLNIPNYDPTPKLTLRTTYEKTVTWCIQHCRIKITANKPKYSHKLNTTSENIQNIFL
jgi:hypothetical protein